MGKTNLFLGIDIGASGVKAALISRESPARMRLIACGEESYPPGNGSAGWDSEHIAVCLRKVLKKLPALPRRIGVGVAITGQAAFVRLVKIPVTGPKKLRQIILYETQQQLPFPVSDVVWDFQVCARRQQFLQVLLAAVKKELVNGIIALTEKASLEIEFLDVSSLAIYNCLEYFYRNLNQSLIVDIGAKTTNLVIVNAGTIWTRSLPIGGGDMTAAIDRQTGAGLEAAEEMKLAFSSLPIAEGGAEPEVPAQQQKISQAMNGVLVDLSAEIIKTLNFYRSQEPEAGELVKIYLTGGVSRWNKVPEFLRKSLSLPVERMDYFNFLAFNSKIDVGLNECIGPAIGLGLRGMGRSALNINLLPEDQLHIRAFRQKRVGILVTMGCFVAAACLWAGAQWFRVERSQRYMQRVQLQASRFEHNKQNLASFESAMALLKRQSTELAQLLAVRHQALALWDAIAAALPDGLWIQRAEFDFRGRVLFLQGRGEDSLTEVGVFQELLQQSAPVRSVRVETVGREADGGLTFSLVVELEGAGGDV